MCETKWNLNYAYQEIVINKMGNGIDFLYNHNFLDWKRSIFKTNAMSNSEL